MSYTTTSVPISDMSTDFNWTRGITYKVLQTAQVLSSFAYIFVGYHLISSPQTLKKTLSLHVILVILAMNFVQLVSDISLALHFLSTGVVRPSTITTCTIWMFIDSFTYYLSLLLMAWASFERHIFIFHPKLFGTNRRRFLFHYMSIFGPCLYALIYYVYVNFLYPCVNQFDFSTTFCGLVCYMILPSPTVFGIEILLHQVLPNFLIGFLSIALIVRALLSRHQLQQSIEWRKYRKMIVQLLSISSLYLVFSVPFSVHPIAQLLGRSTAFAGDVFLNVFSYWAYGICIFLPFVVASSLPNLKAKLQRLITFAKANRVPFQLTTTHVRPH